VVDSDEIETESREDTASGPVRRVLVAFCGDQMVVVDLPQDGSVRIGRAKECEVRIEHASVSRLQAEVESSAGRTLLRDAGSRNGTRVRGVKLAPDQRVPLHPGDVVECGDAVLLLREVSIDATRGMGAKEALAASSRPVDEVVIGAEARWFEAPRGHRVNLGRRGALRRLLLKLSEQRMHIPGRGVAVDQMIDAGWPGEKIQYEAALARVYTSVQRLRSLGLSEVLLTRDDGYVLDPAVPLRIDRG
jgi:hypothetical protein